MEKTLDFKVVFYLLRKKVIWVILAAIVGGLATFLFTENMIPKQYSSSAQVYISNTQEMGEINYSDLNASKSLASTYRIILKSDRSMSLLKEKLQTNEQYKANAYKNTYSVSVSVTDESEVLKISVISRDPKVSQIVCDTMLDVAKELISDIFDGAGKAHSLGDATENSTPVSPNVKSNTMLGAILGFVLASAIIIFFALLDNRVKDEADFVAKINIPVLGEVPSINEETEEKEGYYYYAYTKKENN